MMKLSLILLTLLTPHLGFSYRIGKADDFTLQVVHFNDFHARFEQTSTTSSSCVNEETCIGGFPRLYTKIMELKNKNPDSVVLNAGDNFQGTLWYNVFKWNVTQYFMNFLPIDAHAIGNHEFDDGVEGAVPFIKALKAPMLIANIDDSKEPTIQNTYKPSIVIERNGRKIGIIGTIYSLTNQIANTGNLAFKDEIGVVKAESKKLTDAGVDIIIVLSHSGLDIDRKIAAEAGDYIDLIVGGHSHSLLYNGKPPNNDTAVDVYPIVVNNANNKVLIVQASAFTKYLGDITIKFDSKGKVIQYEGQPIFLENSIKQDEKMLAEMKPFKDEIDKQGKKVVGYTKVELSKNDCTQGECNLGSFICDACIDYLVDQAPEGSWTYAAAIIHAQGGIRTGMPIGNITYSDVIITQPFENTLNTFDIQGKYLLETLEYSASDNFYTLQTSGLKYVANKTNPVGQRIVSATIRCDACKVPT